MLAPSSDLIVNVLAASQGPKVADDFRAFVKRKISELDVQGHEEK